MKLLSYLYSFTKYVSRRLINRRPVVIQRILVVVLFICMISLFYFAYKMTNNYYYLRALYRRHTAPVVDYVCNKENNDYYYEVNQ